MNEEWGARFYDCMKSTTVQFAILFQEIWLYRGEIITAAGATPHSIFIRSPFLQVQLEFVFSTGFERMQKWGFDYNSRSYPPQNHFLSDLIQAHPTVFFYHLPSFRFLLSPSFQLDFSTPFSNSSPLPLFTSNPFSFHYTPLPIVAFPCHSPAHLYSHSHSFSTLTFFLFCFISLPSSSFLLFLLPHPSPFPGGPRELPSALFDLLRYAGRRKLIFTIGAFSLDSCARACERVSAMHCRACNACVWCTYLHMVYLPAWAWFAPVLFAFVCVFLSGTRVLVRPCLRDA